MKKRRLIFVVAALGCGVTVAMVLWAIANGRYLEAVAISCIVPALTWFALGGGKLGK